MKFDYFKSVSAKGVECTAEMFHAVTHEESLIPLYNQIATEQDPERRQALKRRLPAFTFQAHFPDGQRSNEKAMMSGLFMIDIDHVEDPFALYNDNIVSRIKELNIMLVHKTPSTKGLRIVACCRPKLKTLAENQAWLANALGVEQDAACKDAARLSYAVHYSYIFYLDNRMWSLSSPNLPESQPETPSPRPKEERQVERLYRGRKIEDLAAMYVQQTGAPVQGERHLKYCRMCSHFRYITDSNAEVLLAALPDFGLPLEEREAICTNVCHKVQGTEMPKEMAQVLKEAGIVGDKEKEARLAQEADEIEKEWDAIAEHPDWPKLPPIYSYVCRVMPPHFHIPAILTLDSILGTYASNLVATNLNGHPEHTSFHNLIVGPASIGKGELRFLYEKLCEPLAAQDSAYSELWEQYQMKKDRVSNGKKEDLERPFMFFRLAPEKFSFSSILEYMKCAHRQLQMIFTTEIDSLYKSGAHADFDDLYRKAFHQEAASQRYLSAKSFNGIVKVVLSVLATGTPEQFWKHYGNPENGLTSRLHYHFIRERFIPRYVVKAFTKKEEAYINSVIEFAQNLTNEVDEDTGEIVGVKPHTNITAAMEPYVKVCEEFWESNRLLAIKTNDYARDEFSHREGVMLFRGGMIDWLCYKGKLTKEQLQTSIAFRKWLCQMMLENKIQDFGERVNRTYEMGQTPRVSTNIYEALPDEFDVVKLQKLTLQNSIKTPAKVIVYLWKKQGLIEKKGKGLFVKIKGEHEKSKK